MPSPSRRRGPDDTRLSLDEAVGRYVTTNRLVRGARERPAILAPWMLLGLFGALAGVVGGASAALLVVSIGLLTILAVLTIARPSDQMDGLRLALIVCWVAAMGGVIVVITWLEGATGYTGLVLLVGLLVTLPIAGVALLLIFGGRGSWRRIADRRRR